MICIEEVVPADLNAVLDIYNEVIRHSTAVFTEDEYTLERGRVWFDDKRKAGGAFIVARDASGVTGFGSFGVFRTWPGYRHSVEHSVHVRADRRGQGIGRALVQALLARAARAGAHVMLAGIDADNAASIALHRKLGFEVVGHLHEVGYKFGRWLDLKFLQRIIRPDEFS